jgi:hypothetical protein
MADDNGKAIVDAIEAKLISFKDGTSKEVAEAKAEAKSASDKLAAQQVVVDELKAQALKDQATLAQVQDIQKEFNELKKQKGRRTSFAPAGMTSIKSLEVAMGEEIGKQEKALAEHQDGKRMGGNIFAEQLKVSDITSSSMTTTNAYPYANYLDWRPGMEPTGQVRFRDFVRTIPSAYDSILYPRANSPVGGGSFGKQLTETAAKAQVDRGYTMIALQLYPFAGWANVSRGSLRNIPFLQGWLPTSLTEQLMDAEDIDFVNSLSGTATGSTALTAAGTDTNVIAKLVALITNLRVAKYFPNGIAIDPNMWAQVILTKAATSGQYSLPNVVTVDANGNVRILGVPVQPVNWLFGNRVIVGDWTKAAIVESEGLTFRSTDSHASLFVANELTFLLERVEGLAIFRPDAFISKGL